MTDLTLAPGSPGAILFSTFPLDGASRQERAAIYNMINGPAEDLRDVADARDAEPLLIEHVLAHKISSVDEDTGELNEWTRVLLITPINEDGERIIYSSGAKGVIDSIYRIVAILGEQPPWNPPLPIIPQWRTTKNKRRTLILELA